MGCSHSDRVAGGGALPGHVRRDRECFVDGRAWPSTAVATAGL
jgi:hypothetical protein